MINSNHSAVILMYGQIGCALIGSLGAIYNGVLLINLVIALVAIESNSQNLGRTYAVLLLCALLLDEIWSISAETYGAFFIFSVKLSMAMDMIGFFVRLTSSLLWFQMYGLGSLPRETDSDLRNSFLKKSWVVLSTTSLFQDVQSNMSSPKRNTAENNGSPSAAEEASQIKSPISRSLDVSLH